MRIGNRESREINARLLPRKLAALIPEKLPDRGWLTIGDEFGCRTWSHASTKEAFLTLEEDGPIPETRYWLPWNLIAFDILSLEGALIHAAVAEFRGEIFLLAASGGGGKTTAVSRLPSTWTALADDTALVWPEKADWRCSPLPTWGVMLKGRLPILSSGRIRTGDAFRAGQIVFLNKSPNDRLTSLRPEKAAVALYGSLSEHPRMLGIRQDYRIEIFKTSCRLARALPVWKLDLSLRGEYWRLLERLISSSGPCLTG